MIHNRVFQLLGLFLAAGCSETTHESLESAKSPELSLQSSIVTDKTPLGPVTYRTINGEAEKVIGTDDKIIVDGEGLNIPARYRPLLNAFGLLSMGCSATHVGNGIAITAGHCFNAPTTKAFDRPCSDTVEWGYRKNATVNLTSNCIRILEMQTNDNTDYAIFKVDAVPSVKVLVDLDTRPQHGIDLDIFGHPQARPLEWSPAGSRSTPPCRLVVNAQADGGFDGTDMFNHQCDTEPGNSGSSILDDATLKVVGIHNGGLTPWNYATYLIDTPLAQYMGASDGGTPTVDAGTPDAGSNVAMLVNDQPVTVSGADQSQTFFALNVPAGATSLVVTVTGGTGDSDLYVRFGAAPTQDAYECRPYTAGNNETCRFANPTAGMWHVMLRGYRAFSQTTLRATYGFGTGGTDGGVSNELRNGLPVTGIAGASNSERSWIMNVPAGVSKLTISTQTVDGTGDVDLYVRQGQAATASAYDCRPYTSTSNETCSFTAPASGQWYVMLRGYSAYSDVTLKGTY